MIEVLQYFSFKAIDGTKEMLYLNHSQYCQFWVSWFMEFWLSKSLKRHVIAMLQRLFLLWYLLWSSADSYKYLLFFLFYLLHLQNPGDKISNLTNSFPVPVQQKNLWIFTGFHFLYQVNSSELIDFCFPWNH